MSMPEDQIVFQRIQLLRRIEQAQDTEQAAKQLRTALENDLRQLQRKCPHPTVREGTPWQGGGKYYVYTECLVCGRAGDRYSPTITREKGREWYGDQKDESYYEKLDASERDFVLHDRWW